MLPDVAPEAVAKREAQILALARDLNQALTVIAHFADACGVAAEYGSGSELRQIAEWSRRIGKEVEHSGKLIRCLVKTK